MALVQSVLFAKAWLRKFRKGRCIGVSLSFRYNKHKYVDEKQENSLSIKKKSFLKSRGTSRCTCRKASLTVEAAVVLPFFVCFMVFVLYFFRILQVQAGIAQALQFAGRKAAAECSIQTGQADTSGETMAGAGGLNNGGSDANGSGGNGLDVNGSDANGSGSAGSGGSGWNLGSLLKAGIFFQQQLKKQNCPVQYISGGAAGISLLQSELSGNYVELKAVYRMKLPIGLLGDIQYRIVQEAKCRKWTGYQLGQDAQEDDTWLYYTEYGTVYHASRACAYLDLSIQGIPYAQAGQNRNNSGGKYHPCEKCGSQSSSGGMVYITNYGDRYHSSLTCSGLKRSVYMIRKSKAAGKKMCSKCGG